MKNQKIAKWIKEVLFLLSILVYFIICQVLLYFNLSYVVLIISPFFFLIIFSLFLRDFIQSWRKNNLLEIIISYSSVMLVLALIFNFIFISVIVGGWGSAYVCDLPQTKLLPGFYFSVSNVFSLSYTEPICFTGGYLKFAIGIEGILGSLITVAILGFIMALFVERVIRRTN